jgi:hypothetical protein
MPGKVFLSTAYLPPVEYISRIRNADEAYIEHEENYLKQSYRNRCYILSASGPQSLSVPVYLGSFHKTPLKDIRIDYSKRWQQVHLRAMTSSYAAAPYFLYYYETIEKILLRNHDFLLDLNMYLLEKIFSIMKIEVKLSFTTEYMAASDLPNDLRYSINPKKRSDYVPKRYLQVFSPVENFVQDLSIIDLIFNMGPESDCYL